MKLSPEQVIKRYDKLDSDRSNWKTHWQDLIDYFFPERTDIQSEIPVGSKRRNHIFDSTGPHALELFVAALVSMLTPPQLKWLEFSTGDEDLDQDDEIRLFLQKTARKMLLFLQGSNFYTSIEEFYTDIALIGTGIMAIEEDDPLDPDKLTALFTAHPIAKVVVAQNNKMRIDELYREFSWDAKSLVMEFGEENLPEKIVKAFKEGKNDEFMVIHSVYPSRIGTVESEVKKKFISQYVTRDDKKEISIKGFNRFPFIVSRGKKHSGEIYGRSNAMTALPETRMINQMEKTVIRGAQKTIDPPMQFEDDGVMTQPNTTPGGMNMVRAGSTGVRPILNDARVDFGFQVTDRTRTRIREAFYADQLQIPAGPQKTATEVERIVERQLQLLGPFITRMETEFLVPLVNRLWDMMRLREIIKDEEIPAQLSNLDIIPRFSSMMARAQKTSDLVALERALGLLMPLAQFDPGVLDNLNSDEAARFVASNQGLDQRLIRTQEDRDALRQARAEAAQRAQQAEVESKEADSASKVGNMVANLQGVS